MRFDATDSASATSDAADGVIWSKTSEAGGSSMKRLCGSQPTGISAKEVKNINNAIFFILKSFQISQNPVLIKIINFQTLVKIHLISLIKLTFDDFIRIISR